MKTNFTKFLGMLLIVVMCMSFLVACGENESEKKYQQAYELLESKDYKAAYDLFVELGDYKDAAKEAARFHYAPITTTIKVYTDGKEEVETSVTTYNDQNLPLKTDRVFIDGTTQTCNYIINEQLQVVGINYTESTGNDSHIEYTYNEKGELIKAMYEGQDGIETTEYTYTESGNYKKVKSAFINGIIYEEEFFYDENDVIIKMKSITVDGETVIDDMFDFEYDEKGNRIRRVYTVNGEYFGENLYTYDENNNCIKEIIKTADYEKVVEYTYDKNNNCVKEVEHENGILNYEYTMTYDENGNLLKEIDKDNLGNEEHFEYTYELLYVPYEIDDNKWFDLIYYYIGL